jgi:uncharacterized protein (DUF58 family)
MPVPTWRLAAVGVVLAAVRLLLPDDLPGGIWPLTALGVLVAVADWAAAVSPSRIDFEREVPSMLVIGHPGEVVWKLANTTGHRVRVAVADELPPSLHAVTRRQELRLDGHGSATVRVPFRPRRRGRFVLAEVTVRVFGPLGTMARQRTRRHPSSLRVHPPFGKREEAELKINKARMLEVGLRSAQGRGQGTEFEQLREYTAGDDFRRVDWSATARSGRPIVRTYRSERNQTVVVLLDSGRLMAGRVAEVPRFEHGMDAALMLATVATRLGDKCGLMVFDNEVRATVPPARHRQQPGRMSEVLFDLEPTLVESDYIGAFSATVATFRRRALLVLITELTEAAVGAYLLPALPLVTKSHIVVVGSVRDPEVESWAATPTTDAAGAFRRSAAVSELEGRDRIAARLRGLGVTVIDAGPGDLAGTLTDTYLHLKASGRL